jgi:hypothetical protein
MIHYIYTLQPEKKKSETALSFIIYQKYCSMARYYLYLGLRHIIRT